MYLMNYKLVTLIRGIFTLTEYRSQMSLNISNKYTHGVI